MRLNCSSKSSVALLYLSNGRTLISNSGFQVAEIGEWISVVSFTLFSSGWWCAPNISKEEAEGQTAFWN